MRYLFLFLFTCLLLSFSLKAQNIEDSLVIQRDSANQEMVRDYMQKLKQIEQQRISDSIQRVQLELQINALKTSENLKKEDLQRQLQEITERDGNTTTIPSEYRPSDYQSPTHNINVKKSADD